MSSEQADREAWQEIDASRDAYTAARDQTVINIAIGAEQAPTPGPLRPLWGNVPPRNPRFTGRDGLLTAVRESLLARDRTVVQALHGMGGIGKTQLAIEYAHRFADSYDLVWWITAEQPGLIGDQFTALAESLGCIQPAAMQTKAARQVVLSELRGRDRWLLVFDNAEDPEDLAAWLPGGNGHVLITSRTRRWAEIAVPVEVDVLARNESITILRGRAPWLTDTDADHVANAMGDLPLGVVQAAGFMADTGMSAEQYIELLGSRAAQLMMEGRPSSYPRSLAAVTILALDRLRGQDPAAADLATICAFLAPEPVPVDWFTKAAAVLRAPLADKAADAVAWPQVLARLGRSALVRVDHNGLLMHRLTQVILRSSLSAPEADATRELAEAVLAASEPSGTDVPGDWPGWARLLPHVLALDPAVTSNPGLRAVACHAARYLIVRGDARVGHDLASGLYRQWRDQDGPDDHSALEAGYILAFALREMGRYSSARQLDEHILTQRRRILGEDHPSTLASATSLARDLYCLEEARAARELDEDTLARKRRVLGEDHPSTLRSANNLAIDLGALGEVRAARELDEDTLARRRRVLSEDHPDTLKSANNFAEDLRALGEVRAAQELDEDTLARKRRVLGEDHPSTLASASNLAEDLRALGEVRAARELDEDTLARYRRVLGEDHPDTQGSARNLAADLRALGEA